MKLVDKFKILTYNIGFVTKGLDNVMKDGIEKDDIIWLKHNYKDRFFADPFIIKISDRHIYVLCEEYTFWEQKGKIILLIVKKESYEVECRKIIIDEPTHLSFPYCKINGDYIIPESSASGKCYKYNFDINTMSVISKQEIYNQGTIDAILFKNDKYDLMLTGKINIPSSELYINRYDKNQGIYKECLKEPIITDNRHARSAGDFFVWNGRLFRPVQDCQGRYGRQTKIMEILSLTDNKYEATEYITLNSFKNPPYNETLHTFNVYNDLIIVDGSKDFIRFPMKLFYRKFPFLFHYKNKKR